MPYNCKENPSGLADGHPLLIIAFCIKQSSFMYFLPFFIGDVFGYENFFTGLAVFIDTYSNHNGPHNVSHYISL